MNVSFDNPAGVAAPVANYSQVVRLETGDTALLFISGQVALDVDGNLVGKGDVAAQAECIFENIAGILAAHGGDLTSILKTTTLFTNIDDRPAAGEVRNRLFKSNPPASTAFEVSALALPDLLLEVEAIAAVPIGGS